MMLKCVSSFRSASPLGAASLFLLIHKANGAELRGHFAGLYWLQDQDKSHSYQDLYTPI